jgi:hypothetical protein
VVVLTEVEPGQCWLATIEALGVGPVVLWYCHCTEEQARDRTAALADLLDLDRPCRPSWWVQPYSTPHCHSRPAPLPPQTREG